MSLTTDPEKGKWLKQELLKFQYKYIKESLRMDNVNHPSHYTTDGIECIDYIRQVLTDEEFRGYLRGCIIKYNHRLMLKSNPPEDAAKMNWYAAKLTETLRKGNK